MLNQPLMNKSDTKISSLPSHLLLPATNLSSPFTAAVKEREISASKLQPVYVRVFFCKCSLGKNCFCWERNCEKHLCYCLGGNLKLTPSLKALKKKNTGLCHASNVVPHEMGYSKYIVYIPLKKSSKQVIMLLGVQCLPGDVQVLCLAAPNLTQRLSDNLMLPVCVYL